MEERIDARVCSNEDSGADDVSGKIDYALAFYEVHHTESISMFFAQVYKALKSGVSFLIVEPKYHTSPEYCREVEDNAKQTGFTVSNYSKLIRNWSIALIK